jgi:hypothetical protein
MEPAVVLKWTACVRYICNVDSFATRVPMPARRSQPSLAAAASVLSGLGVIMRPNVLRIIFGWLLGVLAASFIGALPLMGPPKAMEHSSAFALRFSPVLPGGISAR